MFCENCGNKLQDDAKMCNMCGKIVVPVEPIATPIVASVQAISNNSFVNNSSQEVSPVEDIQNINDIELSLDDINAEIEAIH
ncbi:MAG: zinc ribbon domain-containing protein, partial [Lachnospiraceae bacterium]|nr:zinc ribbon domain-containing protein [Lachnospiraceae bacterium]